MNADRSTTLEAREWVRRGLSLEASTRQATTSFETSVGELDLAPFQRRAIERGLTISRRYGGVLLADAVGLGKTRVSLALARALSRDARLRSDRDRPAVFCVPARLREQWKRKARQGGMTSPHVVSHTSLSRRNVDVEKLEPGVVVADEAHRFRNPDTYRHRQLAKLCARTSVVLATATPVCNTIWDLYHLLSLFLAEHDLRDVLGCDLEDAFESAESGEVDLTRLVERLVIRRTRPPSASGFGDRPSARLEMLHYDPGSDEQWVWEHLESALRDLSFEACADQWPPELFIEYALRRWESGPRALAETLRGLVEYHRRWLEARRHDRTLNRDDFSELFDDISAYQQEVFPFLFPSNEASDKRASSNRAAIRRDLDALESLLDRVKRLLECGPGPARAVAQLAHSLDDKILIFTKYRRAADGIFQTLRQSLGSDARIGQITGDTARATGLGSASDHELLRRFAPRAQGVAPPADHQQLRILVSTDCLSRGLNLQDCGHVVLADLPYSPLAVEQRIGRLLRPGGPHETVHVYVPRPDDWNDTLGLRRRLRRKLSHARRSGTGFTSADVLEVAADSNDAPFEPTRDDLAEASATCDASPEARPSSDDPRSDSEASDPEQTPREVERRSDPRVSPSGTAPANVGIARIARPDSPRDPLAALTKLEGLARQLDAREADAPEGFWTAEAPIERPALWIRATFESPDDIQPRWELVAEGDDVELRTSCLVRSLVALADARLTLERSSPPASLLSRARRALESRCRQLHAARLAPVPLTSDAPQQQWWRRLCEWIRTDELSMSSDEMETWRTRLLRPFPSGLEHQLGELLEACDSPKPALRRLDDLLERHPVSTGEISAHIVSGLHLRPASRPT